MFGRILATSVLILAAVPSYAQSGRESVALVWQNDTVFPVLEAELLRQEIVEEPAGNFINRVALVTIGLKTLAHDCVKSFDLLVVGGQTSLSDILNPTDWYLRLVPAVNECGFVAGMGRERLIEYTQKFHIDQRRSSEPVSPLPQLRYGKIYHFNYDLGMLSGFNRWGMYRLDLSDLKSISFSHVKNYSYVEGTVQE